MNAEDNTGCRGISVKISEIFESILNLDKHFILKISEKSLSLENDVIEASKRL